MKRSLLLLGILIFGGGCSSPVQPEPPVAEEPAPRPRPVL